MALFVCRVCVRYVAAADRAALPRLCPNCAHPAGFQEVALEAAAPPAAPDHGEPWERRAVIDAYTVHDRHGLRTVTGPRPVRDATGRLMSPVDWSVERDRIDRVVNCVNLLAGVPDAVLVGPRSPLEDLALTVLKASRNPEADGTALALFLDEAQATFSDRVAQSGFVPRSSILEAVEGLKKVLTTGTRLGDVTTAARFLIILCGLADPFPHLGRPVRTEE